MTKISFKGSAMLNPVPSVLITSQNKEGKTNVFTVGWIGTACTKPPMITAAIRPERLSYEYIKETGEFVVNLPSKDMVKAVDFCGVRSGKNIDKIEHCNLTLEQSEKVKVPSIKQCPVSLECKVKTITPLGSHDLFLAEVLAIHVEENLLDENGKIHLEKANLICYSHGEYFSLNSKALGKFGYSVQKKKKSKNKFKK
ncbi:flavin reductase [Clostridium carboxidivorans P7]|uniref:Flavin reductase domain protein FMN-binding n=1 Tax=Clostridium carboxidivorans P7 TaxID=536227 RepID=C6PZI3_9CLOT|nr:flavin reductase family protein [Clostridium carboxidivorans]AKN32651.1 flavin reductase [Clostridium carboxidivorans P7]EET85331.1 flavin reductase domain protein FMN-binding [Clostridium carboxidivorans P7]EFG90122.1 flavin reductase like domain protein [Clostridium carboxidivorans P7]